MKGSKKPDKLPDFSSNDTLAPWAHIHGLLMI